MPAGRPGRGLLRRPRLRLALRPRRWRLRVTAAPCGAARGPVRRAVLRPPPGLLPGRVGPALARPGRSGTSRSGRAAARPVLIGGAGQRAAPLRHQPAGVVRASRAGIAARRCPVRRLRRAGGRPAVGCPARVGASSGRRPARVRRVGPGPGRRGSKVAAARAARRAGSGQLSVVRVGPGARRRPGGTIARGSGRARPDVAGRRAVVAGPLVAGVAAAAAVLPGAVAARAAVAAAASARAVVTGAVVAGTVVTGGLVGGGVAPGRAALAGALVGGGVGPGGPALTGALVIRLGFGRSRPAVSPARVTAAKAAPAAAAPRAAFPLAAGPGAVGLGVTSLGIAGRAAGQEAVAAPAAAADVSGATRLRPQARPPCAAARPVCPVPGSAAAGAVPRRPSRPVLLPRARPGPSGEPLPSGPPITSASRSRLALRPGLRPAVSRGRAPPAAAPAAPTPGTAAPATAAPARSRLPGVPWPGVPWLAAPLLAAPLPTRSPSGALRAGGAAWPAARPVRVAGPAAASAARTPGSPSAATTRTAISSIAIPTSWVRPPLVTSRVPPPGGSRNAWAQLPAGEATAVSGRPLRVAFQSPAGSARVRIPPAAGA